jgi:hypothetical protein
MAINKDRDMAQPEGNIAMQTPPVVSQQEWEAARQQLLAKEKALTRSRDALAAERRRMPWMLVEKKYEFDGLKGKVRLPRMLAGRRSGFAPGASERSWHYPSLGLTRAAGGHHAPEGADGLGDAVVHHDR